MHGRLATLIKRWWGPEQYVVGYPKCGNTWFHVMVRRALVKCFELPDEEIARVIRSWRWPPHPAGVPAIGFTHHMPRFNSEPASAMRLDLSLFRGQRVVLLIREPKDVLVSLYMHNVYREATPLYHGDIDSMVYDAVYGIDKYLRYYATWYAHRRLPEALLLVRYEDLQRQTASVLKEALQFLGMTALSDDVLEDVIQFGSLENMRALEASNALGLAALAPPSRKHQDAFKVRTGLVGGYVDHLSPETVRYVDQRVEAELPPFYGYSASRTARALLAGA